MNNKMIDEINQFLNPLGCQTKIVNRGVFKFLYIGDWPYMEIHAEVPSPELVYEIVHETISRIDHLQIYRKGLIYG